MVARNRWCSDVVEIPPSAYNDTSSGRDIQRNDDISGRRHSALKERAIVSQAIALDTVLARRGDLITSELSDNELVMLSIPRGQYFGVDETAKAIWDALSGPCSVRELVAHLLTRFAVDRETCEREVSAFVNELLAGELVDVVRR